MRDVTFEPGATWKAPSSPSYDGIRRLIFLDRYAQKHASVPENLAVAAVGVADGPEGGRMAVMYEGAAEGDRITVCSLDTGTVYEMPPREIDWVKEAAPADAWRRMARAQADHEVTVATSSVSSEEWERRYEWLLSDFRFVPGGRIWAMLGTGLERTAYNCYVLPIRANDGSSQDSRKAILDTLSNMVEIMARGGGVGINLGTLRPRKARVRGVEGRSSGSVAWGEIFSFATGLVSQGGCFAPDQLIPTDQGEIPAKELYERITAGERLDAFTHLGRRRFVVAFANGRKPVFRVTTASGKSIDITGDHRIATSAVGRFDGLRRGIPMRKVKLQDLRVGDRILSMTEPWLMAEEEIVSIVPLGEMDVYDFEVEEAHMFVVNGLYVSNSRRGALMLMLPVWHPDILEFIQAKKDMSRLTHANISVVLTDEFERALENDAEFAMEFPDYEAVAPDMYDAEWDGDLRKWKDKGYPTRTYRTVRARELWRTIIESAWASAEPGIVRLDYANRMSNSWYFAPLISTNPCSEQYLPAWGVCNLGHLNLARFLEQTGRDDQGLLYRLNWDALAKATHLAVRFLDNIIDITPYFFEENERVQKSERRIGLGTMGLGELLIRMRQRYGSETSLLLIRQIYRFIRDEAYKASIALAKEKGPFLQFDAARFLASGFMQTMPDEIREAIRRHGIRNVTLLTQAPTGSTGTMAGTSTGIEPYYQFVYTRKGELGEHVVVEPVALDMGWYDASGVCKVDRLPHYAVTAMDLAPEDHVRVQAAVQEFTDASISKCVTADTWIPTERGLLPISSFYNEEAPDTFSACTIRLASVDGVAMTSRFYFGGMRPVRRVIARGGWEIAGTDQHRIMVAGNQGLEWRRLWDLRPGDWLAIRIGTDVWPEEDADLSGFTPSPVHGPQKAIRWPSRMNPDLAWLLGAYVADGMILRQNYTVKLFKNDLGILLRFARIVHDQFGIEAKIRKGRTCYEAVVASKTLVEFLTYCGVSTGASHKDVPWAVLRSSRASVLAFLSGVLLDGYVVPKTQRVGLTSKSRMLVRQIQLLLANLGIWSNINIKKSSKYGDFYDLTIVGDHARRLLSLVSIDELHKAERAKAILRMATRANPMDVLPFVRSQEILSELPGPVRARYGSVAKRIRAMADRRMSRSLAVRVLDDPDVPVPDGVAFAVQNHLHFVPIVEVQDAGEQMVYDFEVPGAHGACPEIRRKSSGGSRSPCGTTGARTNPIDGRSRRCQHTMW